MLCAGGHQVAPATPEPAREGPRSPPGSGVQPAHLLQAFHAAATGRPLPRRPVRTRRGRTSGSAWLLQRGRRSALWCTHPLGFSRLLTAGGWKDREGGTMSGSVELGSAPEMCVWPASGYADPPHLFFKPLFSGSRGNDGRGQLASQHGQASLSPSLSPLPCPALAWALSQAVLAPPTPATGATPCSLLSYLPLHFPQKVIKGDRVIS